MGRLRRSLPSPKVRLTNHTVVTKEQRSPCGLKWRVACRRSVVVDVMWQNMDGDIISTVVMLVVFGSPMVFLARFLLHGHAKTLGVPPRIRWFGLLFTTIIVGGLFECIRIPLTEAEKDAVVAAAESKDQKPVSWAHDVLVRAAKRANANYRRAGGVEPSE